MPLTKATEADIAEVSRQLGRPARDIYAIAARCICGKPTVVHTAPRLADGTPFPTTYYLTHRGATAAVSTLEASGLMAQLQDRLAEEPELAGAYQAAHEAFIADRDKTGKELGVDVRVIEDSLKVRRESSDPKNQKKYSNKIVALMRKQFGGHAVHKGK